MKWLIVIFIFIFQTGLAQTIPVFQVLYAEKASLSNGTTLKSLDRLLDETIHVSDSGYLVLIHETGIPLELSSDTTISLKEIHTILDPPRSEKVKKKIAKSGIPYLRHSYQRSLGLDYLFISNVPEARKAILKNARPVLDGGPRNNGVKYPPLIDWNIYFDDDVKVVWMPRFLTNRKEQPTKFTIKLKNEFDDLLMSITANEGEFVLSKSELDKLLKDERNVFIIAENNRDEQLLSVISPFFTKTIRFPYSKDIKTPAAALMAGYFCETYSDGDIAREARPYYELAAQLSDKKFYQEMLNNYLKRTAQ